MGNYLCPECMGRIELTALLTSPPTNVATCLSCGAKFKETKNARDKAILPRNYIKVEPDNG